MTKILLADGHAVVAQGFAALLKDRFEVLGTVFDGYALVAAANRLRPDVVVTGISMPLLNGLDAVRKIKSNLKQAKILILTMYSEPDLVVRAFRAGASGYLLKTSPVEDLEHAIREVAAGRGYVTPSVTKFLIEALIETNQRRSAAGSDLTPRQREVLQLIAEGRTMKETAVILKISRRTAESHKYEMMQALGVRTTAELIRHAVRLKIVSDS
jgi:DNA-binding NarL/FixJ family response regulator